MMKGGVPNSQAATSVRVQTSLYGVTIPLIYGTARVNPKLIWVNDFTATKVASGKKAGGGKKGGNNYDYTCACDFLLGHYPLAAILTGWMNKDFYYLCFASQTLTVSGGQVQITVPGGASLLVYVRSVYLNQSYSADFDDYGSPGPVVESGSWQRPLWNDWFYLPNCAAPSPPYTFGWYPSMGGTVRIAGGTNALDGQQVTVEFWYQVPGGTWMAGMPKQGQYSTAGGIYTGQYVLPQFNLEFEPFLASGSEYVNHPDQQVKYTAFAGVGSTKFDLGSANAFPTMSFEVAGAFPFAPDGCAWPADVITDLIMSGTITLSTAPYEGVRMPIGHGLNLNNYSDTSAPLPVGNFLGDLTAMRNYCQAYNIRVSLYLDTQDVARTILQDLFDIANCAPVWSGAQLKAIPYCEVSAAGNGAIYTAPTASGPVCDLDDRAFLISGNDAPVTVDRTRQADADNVISVECLDATNAYNVAIVTEVEQRSVHQFGIRKGGGQGNQSGNSGAVQYHQITYKDVAQKVASVLVKRSALQRNTYSFSLPVTYSFLEAMDLVTITDTRLGLVKKPVRLTSVKESFDDTKGWTLECEAEQFIYGLNEPTPMEIQAINPYALVGNTPPGNTNAPVIFEVPDRLGGSGYNVWMGLAGSSPQWGGCLVWMSVDGTNYEQIGYIFGRSVMGTLAASLPFCVDPDNTNTLQVDLSGSLGALASVSPAARDSWQSLCYVDGELIGYEDGNAYRQLPIWPHRLAPRSL